MMNVHKDTIFCQSSFSSLTNASDRRHCSYWTCPRWKSKDFHQHDQQQQQQQLHIQRRIRSYRTSAMGGCIPVLWIFFFVLFMIVTTQAAPFKDFSCDVRQDDCPSTFNGICDEATCGAGKDCYDCDQCGQFDFDCTSCLEHNCWYCSGDGTCQNSNLYTLRNIFSHCTSPEDYTRDSCTQPGYVFNDPAYGAQRWVYQMIDVEDVWRHGYTGQNVHVRINDNGVEASNAEFRNRFSVQFSCRDYLPDPSDRSSGHGTTTAAIVGAAANNNRCSVGIAPEVTLSSCHVWASSINYWYQALDQVDISQNSYGVDGCTTRNSYRERRQLAPTDNDCPFQYQDGRSQTPCGVCDFTASKEDFTQACESLIKVHCNRFYKQDQRACLEFLDVILGGSCLYDVLDDFQRAAIVEGITQGRDGKGIIYTFASGNAFKRGDDTNIQAYTNSRFLISVGAVNKDRIHASYSTPGASLMVSAPGGDSGNVANHVATSVGGTCGNVGVGTSWACPVVSGVVALMLEVNPQLTWRDVQYILAQTSSPVPEDTWDTTATKNAAGYWHSNLYGFGIVNAKRAVETSLDWTLVGDEEIIVRESGMLNLPIVDDVSVFLKSSMEIEFPSNSFTVESVVVQLDLEHFSRGHLEIILTSPEGTDSVLHPGERPENQQPLGRWKLLTVRNWGESPQGEWKLTIVDLQDGDVGDCSNEAWMYVLGQQILDCGFLERMPLCQDGRLDPGNRLSRAQYNAIFGHRDFMSGRTATEACCACGGGLTRSDVTDQLRQWTLVIYGNDQPEIGPRMGPDVEPSAPTKSPTTSPSVKPTPSQTRVPTPSPTDATTSPTSRPTKEPTPAPTKEPTTQPTPAPTERPTEAPTRGPSASPSASPSEEPTSRSTSMPSLYPSQEPSTAPTTTAPSAEPTFVASEIPTISAVNPPVAGVAQLPATEEGSTGDVSVTSSPTTAPLDMTGMLGQPAASSPPLAGGDEDENSSSVAQPTGSSPPSLVAPAQGEDIASPTTDPGAASSTDVAPSLRPSGSVGGSAASPAQQRTNNIPISQTSGTVSLRRLALSGILGLAIFAVILLFF